MVAALAVILVGVGAVAFLSLSRPAYACQQFFDPTPAPTYTLPPTAAPGASGGPVSTPQIGYVQPDMGHLHVNPGSTIRYTLCPPASGRHFQAPNGPIKAGVYGPDAGNVPGGWIHNLEHGGFVLLYKCPGAACDAAGQEAMKQLYARWPNSPVCNIPKGNTTPVFTRFDDMPWPYAAVVWDVILPLQTLDEPLILAFFEQQAEQYNPEKQCAGPTEPPSLPTPVPSSSAAPGGSPAASVAPSGATPSGSAGSPAPAGS